MQLKLTELFSTDNIKLPALLYEPLDKTKKAVINLHGNGSASVFYSTDRANTFGEILTKNDIAFFTFNNRGAHFVKSLKKYSRNKDEEPERLIYGTSYELINECIFDIDGAIQYLKELGYEEFYLLGHSTGANKICVYNHYKNNNEISGYILAGGGDDSGIYYQMMGEKKFNLALRKSKQNIENDNGEKLVPKYILDRIMSYQSLYDTINPDGDYNCFPFFEYLSKTKLSKTNLFRYFSEITKPTLVLYGDQDIFAYESVEKCVEAMIKHQNKKAEIDYSIIEGADHGFDPHTDIFAEKVKQWILNTEKKK